MNEPLAEVEVFLTDGAQRSSGQERQVGLGVVSFGNWQVSPLPSGAYATQAYLIRVDFDFRLAPEVPGPVWAEVTFEFPGGRARVLDAVPRSILTEQDERSYSLDDRLNFTQGTASGGRLILLEGLAPTIRVFGLGGTSLTWRHTATTPAGVPVGSHTGWLVAEAPPGDRELSVRFSASYRLTPEDAMGMAAGSRPVELTVALPAPDAPSHADADADAARRVFLIHGRDDVFVGRMRELLSLLGLRVMEWEALVAGAGLGPSPALGDVIHDGLSRARAIVALLTPDDVVSLHRDLVMEREDPHELAPACQPRPNVLMELGAALFAFRDRTIVVQAGRVRPMADIGGVNYIAFDDSEGARAKLVERLRVAGCDVDDSGQEWRRADRFAGLGVFDRKP
jgi:predicted nucleotide-binding protein